MILSLPKLATVRKFAITSDARSSLSSLSPERFTPWSAVADNKEDITIKGVKPKQINAICHEKMNAITIAPTKANTLSIMTPSASELNP